MEILLVNKAISILVNHVESFLELLDLGLIKHSEYIGSRPLGTLLGSLRLGLFAGHGGGMKGACSGRSQQLRAVLCGSGHRKVLRKPSQGPKTKEGGQPMRKDTHPSPACPPAWDLAIQGEGI